MTDHNRESQFPKPYAFVSLGQKPQTRPPAGHARYLPDRLSGRLEGVLVARSPVHVASGLLEPHTADRKYPLVKAHFCVSGKPTIPGASLKGCIRSIVEALSSSAITQTHAQIPRKMQPSCNKDKLDVTQRLFGAMDYLGQVCLSDAPADTDRLEIVPTPQLFRPRREARDAYYDGNHIKGRKFYRHGKLAKGDLPLEACPIGTRFPFTMDFINLTPGELGLLLTALGLGQPSLWPKLGGGKPACLGTIEVTEHALLVDELGRAAYAAFDPPPPKKADTQAYLEAAHTDGLLQAAQLAQLAEILHWPNDERACPGGTY